MRPARFRCPDAQRDHELIAGERLPIEHQYQPLGIVEPTFLVPAQTPAHLPALRECVEEVSVLFEHFVRQTAAHTGGLIRVLSGVARRLEEHDWHGDVRALRTVAERLVYESQDGYVTHRSVCELLGERSEQRNEVSAVSANARPLGRLDALARHGRNALIAARELGISRATIYRRMRELGVRRPHK